MKCFADTADICIGDKLRGGLVKEVVFYPYWHPYVTSGYIVETKDKTEFVKHVDVKSSDIKGVSQ